jgi:anti-anti-sigma factor
MALTMLPPPSEPIRGDRSAFMTPGVRVEGTRTVVVLRGGTDVSTRPVPCDVLSRVAVGARAVVIDLAEVTFIDTATARVLATAQQLDRQNRGLTFRSPSRLAGRVLHMFGLTDLIEAEPRPTPDPPQRPSVHRDGLDYDRPPMRAPPLSDSDMDQVGWVTAATPADRTLIGVTEITARGLRRLRRRLDTLVSGRRHGGLRVAERAEPEMLCDLERELLARP